MKKRISIEEGKRLLEEYGTPEQVRRHCLAVCRTASLIGRELNRNGYHLDIALIEGAAITHDIARAEDRHWERGAEIVRELGYEDEADIIFAHMNYIKYSPIERINDSDVVCIADRTVREDRFVGLDERIEYIIDKARSNGLTEEKAESIRKSMQASRIYLDELEKIIGMSLSDLCGEVNGDE